MRVRDRAEATPPSRLAADSLAYSLLLGARAIAAVRSGQSLSQALAALAEQTPLARAAAQDLACGVLRGYRRDDFLLARLLDKALTHAETESLLLAALYRLQTRPESPHVVVDQAVAAASELAAGAFKGLVNGVLRNYLRRQTELHAALAADDEALLQHPQWWLTRLRRSYPAQWPQIVAAGNAQPPMTLRVNRRRTTVAAYVEQLAGAGLPARPVGPWALLLDKPTAVSRLPGFSDGLSSVQDAGAQRAAEILNPADGERILDACAAPGGKTAHLLEAADVEAWALDIDATRARQIDDNLQRLGLRAEVRVADCRTPAQWWSGQFFDAILADVPCSASGVVRRHPDIKTLRRESDIRRFALQQTEILDRLWPLLKPGGRLLYATCSVFPEENAGQIDAFLFRHAAAQRLHEERLLPSDENDGFYYALLRKAV